MQVKKRTASLPNEPKEEFEFPYTYMQVQANKISSDTSYNRPINRKEVEDIIKHFNPNLVNPCKLSYRDNKYWIFDGNHTLTALIERANGDDSIYVDCKVYTGMTREDEAKQFALQNGDAKKVSSSYQIRALAVSKDPEVMRFQKVTEQAGAKCSFCATNSPYHIKCYDTAFKLFKKHGDSHYYDVISTVIKAWSGHPDSLRKEIICGVSILLTAFPNIDKTRLVTNLSKESPVEIISRAKSNEAVSGNTRFAVTLCVIYNNQLSKDKKLPLSALFT
jgi:hypothetical protein